MRQTEKFYGMPDSTHENKLFIPKTPTEILVTPPTDPGRCVTLQVSTNNLLWYA